MPSLKFTPHGVEPLIKSLGREERLMTEFEGHLWRKTFGVSDAERLALYIKPRHIPLTKVGLRNVPHTLKVMASHQFEKPLRSVMKRFKLANELVSEKAFLHNGVKAVWISGTLVQGYLFYNALRRDGQKANAYFSFGTDSKRELTAWGAGTLGGLLGTIAGAAVGTLVAKKPGFKIGAAIGAAGLGALMNYAARDSEK